MPCATSPMPDRSGAPLLAPSRSRPGRSVARTVLGVLLIAMAAGQLSDMDGFAGVLAGYQVMPSSLLAPAAWLLAGTEATAGWALLSGRKCGSHLALAVAVAWSLLAIQGFARGLVIDNCGCFGVHLAQPLRWWVLVEDAQFVALAAWVRHRERAAEAPNCVPAWSAGRS